MRSRKGAAGGKEGSGGPPQRSTPADQPSAHAAASRADDGAGSSGGGAAGEQDSAKFIRSYLGQGAATFARFPGAGSGTEDDKPQTLLKNEDPVRALLWGMGFCMWCSGQGNSGPSTWADQHGDRLRLHVGCSGRQPVDGRWLVCQMSMWSQGLLFGCMGALGKVGGR